MKAITRLALTTLSLAGTLGLGVLSTAAPASAVEGPAGCSSQHTTSSYQVSCSEVGPNYRAAARCTNGQWVHGSWAVNAGDWSTATCPTGTRYVDGTGYADTGGVG